MPRKGVMQDNETTETRPGESGSNNSASRKRLKAREVELIALSLYKEGWTYEEMARKMNMSVGGVWKAIKRAYERRLKEVDEAVEENRLLNIDRTNEVIKSMYPAMLRGNTRAAQVVLNAIRLHAEMTGVLANDPNGDSGNWTSPVFVTSITVNRQERPTPPAKPEEVIEGEFSE